MPQNLTADGTGVPTLNYLETLLLDRGLTQAELAARSGVDRSHVSRLVRGEHLPRGQVAARLVEALDLGITPAQFVARMRATSAPREGVVA